MGRSKRQEMAIDMSKIFIDDKIWEQEWFQQLQVKENLVYIYIFTRSDHAGFLEINVPLANFLLNLPTEEHFTKETFTSSFGGRIIWKEEANRLWIPSKIIFQQGLDKPPHQLGESIIHKSITALIYKNGCQEMWKTYLSIKYRDSKELIKSYSNSNNKSKSKKNNNISEERLDEIKKEQKKPDCKFKHKNVDEEYEQFLDYCKAHGKQYASAFAGFKNWLRRDFGNNKVNTPEKPKTYIYSCEQCSEVQVKSETKELYQHCHKCDQKLKILI